MNNKQMILKIKLGNKELQKNGDIVMMKIVFLILKIMNKVISYKLKNKIMKVLKMKIYKINLMKKTNIMSRKEY